jgi:hypothetical protein
VPQWAACFTCQAVPPNGLERRPKHGSLAHVVPGTQLMALRAVSCLSRPKFHVPRACPFDPAQKYRTNVWSKLWCNKVSDYTIIMYGNTTCCDRIAQWISASDFGSEGLGLDSHLVTVLFFWFLLLLLIWWPPVRNAGARIGRSTNIAHV